MQGLDNLAYRYNRIVIAIVALSPFLAWVTLRFWGMDIKRFIQLLSFLGIFLLLIFKKKSQPFIFPRYLLFYLLFIFYVFFSEFIKLGRPFEIKYLFASTLIGGFNFMLIIENISIPKKYYNFLLVISGIILILAVITIVIQQTIDPLFFVRKDNGELYIITGVDQTHSRLYSIYSWVGGFTSIGFGFVPLYILITEHLNNKKKNVIIWVILGLVFALLSKARWIMINALLVFVIFFISKNANRKKIVTYIFMIPLIFIASFYILEEAGINAQGIITSRILESDKKNINEKSASTRILAFKAFNALYWDNPFFGKGDIKYGMAAPKGKQDYELSRFLRGRSSQIHVGYLSLFYLYGLVGGILFLSFLFLLLKKLRRDAKATKIWGPYLGFLGFALANLTLVTFEIFYVGLVLAFVANRYYTQNIHDKKLIDA